MLTLEVWELPLFQKCGTPLWLLVAQMKRMTTELRLLLRFNAASLATNLTTTTMYSAILNGTILNLARSLHDQVARVNNCYSESATWAIHQNPIPLSNKTLINQGWVRGVLPVENQENEWTEAPHVQLFAARSYWTQTSSYENEASFLFRLHSARRRLSFS